MDSNSRSAFIKSFFKILEDKNVPYVVLRNYDGLPNKVGNDIDLLVTDDYLDNFEKVLCSVGLKNEWYITEKQKRYGFRSYLFFNGNDHSKTLKWDVWAPITWKGLTWVNSEFIMKKRVKHDNGFFIPPKGAEAATLVLKETLQNGIIREKNYKTIEKFAREDPKGFKNVLKKYFNSNLLEKLIHNSAQGKWKEITKEYNKLRLNLILNSLKNDKFIFPVKLFRFSWGHFREKMSSDVAIFICLIGPDGSGKTTISTSIMESIGEIFDEKYYFHGHYGFFPEFKNLVPSQKYKEAGKEYGEKLDEKVPGGVIPYLLVIYYSLEYIIGYHYLNLKNRNKKTLMLFDRYFYDYIIQPGPFKMENFYMRLLLRIIPQPDRIIYLHSPPELVHNRKPELSVDEIQRQLKICDKILKKIPITDKIDNSAPLDDVLADIYANILTIYTKKKLD